MMNTANALEDIVELVRSGEVGPATAAVLRAYAESDRAQAIANTRSVWTSRQKRIRIYS